MSSWRKCNNDPILLTVLLLYIFDVDETYQSNFFYQRFTFKYLYLKFSRTYKRYLKYLNADTILKWLFYVF